MLTKEYEITRIFVEKPWSRFALNQVKQGSKKKSKGYVYNTLQKYVKEKLLSEEKAGNVTLYSLNLSSLKAQSCAGFIAEYIGWSKKHLPYEDLQRIALKMPTDFFILLITGSYANNSQGKGSDLDLVIICDDSFEPKRIYAELKHDCELNIPLIHLYVFKKSEFKQMLLSSKPNYGKEIAKNNLLLCGGQQYFRILSEVMKNGFNG